MRSNWARATDPKPAECPFCGEDRPDMIDINELGCHCNTCGLSWLPPCKPPEPQP